MSKRVKPSAGFTGVAYALVKVPSAGTLFEAVEFTIENGKVINTTKVTRGPDAIDICAAKATYHLLESRGQKLEE